MERRIDRNSPSHVTVKQKEVLSMGYVSTNTVLRNKKQSFY